MSAQNEFLVGILLGSYSVFLLKQVYQIYKNHIRIKNRRMLTNEQVLKDTEQQWQLYNDKPIIRTNYIFNFHDLTGIGGHCLGEMFPLNVINGKTDFTTRICNNVILINLNTWTTERSLIHTIIHEDLHAAINWCLGSNYDKIEQVIDCWMIGEISRLKNEEVKVIKVDSNGKQKK